MTKLWQPNPALLYHLSEDATISQFAPRPHPRKPEHPPIVWAIQGSLVANYLLPRDCPRICMRCDQQTSPDDQTRFFGLSNAQTIIAIEHAWLDRIRATTLYAYAFEQADFELADAAAGYWISFRHVDPIAMHPIDDLLGQLVSLGVELHVMPNLWRLHDSVAQSSLQFSMIRMRNATARSE
ncbi:MAG TPA: hypothetical protein DEF47_19755 [Herpetosiphon sp.]|uniref:Uncharacterized protein n=1 Tax=Herpetosiphon aurantiacus (strain ATCC 23779 / DSM 785 / 114-95) TaxID=316274 RepID=A9B3K9_HERA2|nr:DUF6886 family protein [Herpetosiphon sp.]ABX05581.1 conserved hypothetical protein [Herpetosiphon aurantiacus DSM 785]HBW52128.1 hypothetical protein [Herpetosiphon sp.]